MRDLRGLLGKEQEDDRLGIFGGVRDEWMECCMKQLNTRMVQICGLRGLRSCNEDQLLGFIKAIAVRGVYKEVDRTAFHGMHQQQMEFYQAYVAKIKAKAELCQYMMVAPVCKDDLCNCSGHKRQLYYRDEMVGTQLVAGAFNKEHQAKLLSETASLHSLEDKLDRLCIVCWRIGSNPPPCSLGFDKEGRY